MLKMVHLSHEFLSLLSLKFQLACKEVQSHGQLAGVRDFRRGYAGGRPLGDGTALSNIGYATFIIGIELDNCGQFIEGGQHVEFFFGTVAAVFHLGLSVCLGVVVFLLFPGGYNIYHLQLRLSFSHHRLGASTGFL